MNEMLNNQTRIITKTSNFSGSLILKVRSIAAWCAKFPELNSLFEPRLLVGGIPHSLDIGLDDISEPIEIEMVPFSERLIQKCDGLYNIRLFVNTDRNGVVSIDIERTKNQFKDRWE